MVYDGCSPSNIRHVLPGVQGTAQRLRLSIDLSKITVTASAARCPSHAGGTQGVRDKGGQAVCSSPSLTEAACALSHISLERQTPELRQCNARFLKASPEQVRSLRELATPTTALPSFLFRSIASKEEEGTALRRQRQPRHSSEDGARLPDLQRRPCSEEVVRLRGSGGSVGRARPPWCRAARPCARAACRRTRAPSPSGFRRPESPSSPSLQGTPAGSRTGTPPRTAPSPRCSSW
eukprot:3339488-Rhodomonas_salina.1